MSHELRTPMNAILGFGQLLEMQGLEGVQHESLSYILKGGKHLLNLINEVLDISNVEDGRIDFSLESVSVAEIVKEACTLMGPLAAERSVTIEFEQLMQSGLVVVADVDRLKQVLINLVSNGIKYNEVGGQVHVSCRQLPNDRTCIEIQDTGPGISSADLEKLFTPFERLSAANSGIEGTGLGLALSRSLVTGMGGSLVARSDPGHGSVFSIELAQGKDVVDVEAQSQVPAASKLSGQETNSVVLCIEDNLSNLRLFEAILESRPNVRLISAMQGTMGLDLARQNQPNLVILDLHLPDIPGSEVLASLQASPTTRSIPVIVISADATARRIDQLFEAGARAYLTKPINVVEFLHAIDGLLV